MTDSAKAADTQIPLFASAWRDLYDQNLCPMPAGGPEGNAPLLRWAGWTRRPTREFFESLGRRRGTGLANVGILTGLSRITIVDCDDGGLVDRALELFGHTPLVTATPSGGYHLWYRGNGERCANLRNQGFPIDIKGVGGFSLEPPSIRRFGPHHGKLYRFCTGSLADIDRLPRLSPRAFSHFQIRRATETTEAAARRRGRMPPGTRNNSLFTTALWLARTSDSLEELTASLVTANDLGCGPPLEPPEVAKVAASAWRYETSGTNMVGTGAFIIANDRLDGIASPDDLYLLARLWRLHAARGSPFAIVPHRMAGEGSMRGMSAAAIRRAREALVGAGYLELVHKGGHGPRDPSLYVLGSDPRVSLSISAYNTKDTAAA